MARTGSSSKFVPVNLNNSYGQTLLPPPGASSASSALARSRSFGNYGGMVSLSRSSRAGSSPSSASASRSSKLAVPRPVNLPSLRREHSGNDPTVSLVGSHGSSGWNKQNGDDAVEICIQRSDAVKGDAAAWGNRVPTPEERRLLSGGRHCAMEAPTAARTPVIKAVVFRGEEFPTLQAATAPSFPSQPPFLQSSLQSRGSQPKHRDRPSVEEYVSVRKEHDQGDEFQESNRLLDRYLQPAEPRRIQARSALLDHVDDVDRGNAHHRGPFPLIKLHRTSNWIDDERETLSSVRILDRDLQGDRVERNDRLHTVGDWSLDRNTGIDFRRPTSRLSHPDRNEPDFLMQTMHTFKAAHAKDVEFRREFIERDRSENNTRGDIERSSRDSRIGRNNMLKRGWSFPATDSHPNRDTRYTNPNNRLDHESYMNGTTSFQGGLNVRHDASSRDIFFQDGRSGSQHQDGGQWHDSKVGKDVFSSRQGFSGGVAVSGPRFVRGSGLSLNESSLKTQSGNDYRREKSIPGFYGQARSNDTFLGEVIVGRPPALYVSQPKVKKDDLNADNYRDPARESFEAELERVEKMLEQERQRAVEEREKAIQLVRKELEEQERIAREEEEMRRKVEDEVREAAYRLQREAEEAARKVEEARRAREEEKHMAESEEQRRKEAARRKLLELEERIAKRELEKRQEDATQKERGFNSWRGTKDVNMDGQESWLRKNEASKDPHWKSESSLGKPDVDFEEVSSKVPVNGAGAFPTNVRLPRGLHIVKEENGYPTEGVKLAQTWKKESPSDGQEPRPVQKGLPNFLHLRTQLGNKGLQQDIVFKNRNKLKNTSVLRKSRAFDDADERDFWVRDINGSIVPFSPDSDLLEYPSYGRIRQSLPKQPRVLPPPPGNAMSHKPFQAEENYSAGSSGSSKSGEESPQLNEGNESLTGDGVSTLDSLGHASKQFDAVPSEEVVLSDAGSQFSDDSSEDVHILAEQEPQEPDLCSDTVSESFSDREVDEISDLTDTQESSEDGEYLKPAGDKSQDWIMECDEEKGTKADESLDGLSNVGKGGLVTCPAIEEQDEDGQFEQKSDSNCLLEDTSTTHLDGSIRDVSVPEHEGKQDEDGHFEQNYESSCLIEDISTTPHSEGSIRDVSVPEHEGKQEAVVTELQTEQEVIKKGGETSHNKQMLPFVNQPVVPPVVSNDVTQMRPLEGLSSRPSLVQQFQQPFSFMAVPLPTPGTLSHVGASLPTLSAVQTPNQQDLPFHVQLGLMPSLPLLPNAIQIGSIQMPLHIHSQISQMIPLNSHQQAPFIQFGQIGPSLALSQPISMTQVPPSSMQMLNASGHDNSLLHSQLQLDGGAEKTTELSVHHQSLENAGAVEAKPRLSSGCSAAIKEHAEIAQQAYEKCTVGGVLTEKEIQGCAVKQEMETAIADSVLQLDDRTGQSVLSNNELVVSSQTNYAATSAGRPLCVGRRSSNPPHYRGILALGRGRQHSHGGHYTAYPVSQLAAEIRPEGVTRRFFRGKASRKNYRRVEYRVRDTSQYCNPEMSVPDSFSGPFSNVEDAKESGGYRYIRRGSGGNLRNSRDESEQLAMTVPHSSGRIAANLSVSQSIDAGSAKSKSLLRKYEVINPENAPFQSGVVRVFEQLGIETSNDKDDFIKVRSKRQLLRESRQQREKEHTSKSEDGGSKHLASKKQPRVSAKIAGAGTGMMAANASKNNVKRQFCRSDDKSSMVTFANGTAAVSSTPLSKRSSALSKVASASESMILESECSAGYGNDICTNEHSITAAWGGQQSHQEVVSLTQIQLEEAMKPYRLDAPFPEPIHSSDKAFPTLEPVLPCSSSLSLGKTVASVKALDPLSSLLAGEKIQFGAVTSPTPMPPENCSPTQASSVRTGSIDFGSDPLHMSSHRSSFATSFLDSHLDATYSLKGDFVRKDDSYEGKIADLEAEAAAEAAASAVVAAAINIEDLVDSNSNPRAPDMKAGCTSMSSGLSVANAISGQVQNHCISDNPIAVALPADLSVEMPPSLFQGSPVTLSNSSGVVLQTLQGGAPTFPFLEMGPLIGGPIFNFGPREDPSMAPMEPGVSGWQQMHGGAPDSYYGSQPFLSPAGLSNIQGRPHMLVYTNPYTPVGQFGQLGVSFMGTTYHPSGKQPDWTYVPVPTASSGALAVNNGDFNAVSSGMMPPQHHGGASNLIQMQGGFAASAVTSAPPPPNLFDSGFAAPFQVSQMDGVVQSHWSKAPAPPSHGVSAAGSALPLSLSRPDVDHSVHPNVLPNQGGHLTNHMGGSDSFQQRSMKNTATRGPLSSAVDASSQFSDELGLGYSFPAVSSMQTEALGPLSDADHLNRTNLIEAFDIRRQHGHRSLQSSQGRLNGVDEARRRDFISSSCHQEQNRGGFASVESQNKTVGRYGCPEICSSTADVQASEQKTSNHGGGEWIRGIQRKGASARTSTLERGSLLLPSKLKQIYVAKPTGDSREPSSACS